MRLAAAILTITFLAFAASTTADGRGIRIEGVGHQQDVSIGRETQVGRSESGILLLGEFPTEQLPGAMPFEITFPSNPRFPRKRIETPQRSRSGRGFRYGEGLGYAPGTRNAARYRTTAFQYRPRIRHGNSFSYGSGLRYGQELRHAIGRQR